MSHHQPLPLAIGPMSTAIDQIYNRLPGPGGKITRFGLTKGCLGFSVFCCLYGLHAGKRSCLLESSAWFKKALTMIGTDPVYGPWDTTELGMVSQFLVQTDVIGDQCEGLLENADTYVLGRMRQQVKQFNFGGFASGAISGGIYFLSRARCDPRRFAAVIRELAADLLASAVSSQNECHWYPDQPLPLTLWNGQAAVILFLTAAADQDFIERKRVESTLVKAVNFLDFRLRLQQPSSLLSFQMGDLGAGYALLRAGKVFSKDQWCACGLEFLGQRAGSCLANAESIRNAGMLTGAAGAALAFNKIHALTGNTLFEAAAELCFAMVLPLYQPYTPDQFHRDAVSELCFTTGSLGVGAGLIKWLHRHKLDLDPLLWLI